jgi:hypothetical protein
MIKNTTIDPIVQKSKGWSASQSWKKRKNWWVICPDQICEMNKLYGVPELGETGHENGSVMCCTHHRKGEHTVGGIHHPPDGQPNRKTSGWRNVRAWGSYRSSNRTRRPYHVVGPLVPQQNVTVAQPFKQGLCNHLTGPVLLRLPSGTPWGLLKDWRDSVLSVTFH